MNSCLIILNVGPVLIFVAVTLLTGQQRCLPVFPPWNGHPHSAGAELFEGGRYVHSPQHPPKQHHSALWYMIYRDEALIKQTKKIYQDTVQ